MTNYPPPLVNVVCERPLIQRFNFFPTKDWNWTKLISYVLWSIHLAFLLWKQAKYLQVNDYEIIIKFFHISHDVTWYSAIVHKFTIIHPVCSTYKTIHVNLCKNCPIESLECNQTKICIKYRKHGSSSFSHTFNCVCVKVNTTQESSSCDSYPLFSTFL